MATEDTIAKAGNTMVGEREAMQKQVAEGSEALKIAHKQGARAGREAAWADTAEKEIALLREELSGNASKIGRLGDALVNERECSGSTGSCEREAMWAS